MEKTTMSVQELSAQMGISLPKASVAENIGYAIHHRNHKDGCRNKSIANHRGCDTDVSGNHRGQKCIESREIHRQI